MVTGLLYEHPDPKYGEIVRDAWGVATGLLREAALSLVAFRLPAPTQEERKAALVHALEHALSRGITVGCMCLEALFGTVIHSSTCEIWWRG